MTILALWCHPRSVSTAFERVMRARGDLAVLHEPFLYHHYLTRKGRLFPGFDPDPAQPQRYPEICAQIRDRAGQSPLFFKDMAYYALPELEADPAFLNQIAHAFLVRDPAEAILSYHKLDPEFEREELGHEAQHRLYHRLRDLGHDPVVLTSDQLRRDPRGTLSRYWAAVGLSFADHAFDWDDSMPAAWQAVEAWHGGVLGSRGIKPPEPPRDRTGDLAALGDRFLGYDRHHRPFYDALRAVAEQQAHQK